MSQRYYDQFNAISSKVGTVFSLNNTTNPTFVATGYELDRPQTTTGTVTFVDDHPFLSNGKSASGSTNSSIMYNYMPNDTTNNPNIFVRNGISFWLKYEDNLDGSVSNEQILQVRGATGAGDSIVMGISLVGGFGVTRRRIRSVLRDDSGQYNFDETSYDIQPNVWTNISLVFPGRRTSSISRVPTFMHDGIKTTVRNSGNNITNTQGINRVIVFPRLRNRISEVILFNDEPTSREIAKLIASTKPDKTAKEAILQSNPNFFYDFDIESKTTPTNQPTMNNLGFETNVDVAWNFGGSDGAAWTVNVEGADNKGWRFVPSSTAAHNRVVLSGLVNPSRSDFFRNKLYSMVRDSPDGFSFEFWYKTFPMPQGQTLATHTFFSATNSGAVNLPITISLKSQATASDTAPGTIETSMPYPASTGWLTGSTTVNSAMTARFDDNDWHHCVITYKKHTDTSTGNLVNVYVDGLLVASRSYSNTPWAQFTPGTQPYSGFLIGHNTSLTADARARFLDSFIAYNKVLTTTEIYDHFHSWLNEPEVAQGNPVRYWNGSAWIDSADQLVWNGTAWVPWGAQHWDGTQWVAVA